MFNEILVPVDLNEDGFSDKAVAMACEIVREGGKLHLLKVTPGYQMAVVGSFFPPDSNRTYQDEAKESLEEFAERTMKGKPVCYTTQVREGKTASEIVRYAGKKRGRSDCYGESQAQSFE